MKLELKDEAFISDLAKAALTPGIRPIDAIEQLLSEHLVASLETSFAESLLEQPVVHIHEIYNKHRCLTLSDLAAQGYKTWYADVKFSTHSHLTIKETEIEPVGIRLEDIEYGGGVKRAYQIKTTKLKTKTNHLIRLNTLVLDSHIFERTISKLEGIQLEQPYVANPKCGPEYVCEFISFDHIVTGQRSFCTCTKPVHINMLEKAQADVENFAQSSWPHKVIEILTQAAYVDRLCHLCVAEQYGASTAAEKYGDNMHEFLPPYIDQLMITRGLDKRTARGEVQEILKLSRWIRESEMYGIIKKIFPDNLVFREASPPWLGRQRLDVFLPELNLAFEYQGEQHYTPIEAFGGAAALERTIERDAIKKSLCDANNVKLVYIKFDEALTYASLKNKLRHILP